MIFFLIFVSSRDTVSRMSNCEWTGKQHTQGSIDSIQDVINLEINTKVILTMFDLIK